MEKNINNAKAVETSGTIVFGAPGTGKTLCLTACVEQSYKNGERGIIYDMAGDEYFGRFFNPEKDILLNFFDARCKYSYNFFNDIADYEDIKAIAASVGSFAGGDPFWETAMKDILAAAIVSCHANLDCTPTALFNLLNSPPKEIKRIFKRIGGTEPAHRYFKNPESAMCQAVMKSLLQQVAYLPYMDSKGEKPLVIKDWIENGEGFIYLANQHDIRHLGGVNTIIIDTLCRKLQAKARKQTMKKRTYIYIDEFASLNPCISLASALNSRGTGIKVFLGLQSISQLDNRYGEKVRDEIIAGCVDKIVFRLGDTDTAKYFEGFFGQKIENGQMSSIIPASELISLPTKTAILSFTGLPLSIVDFPIIDRPAINKPRFVLRNEITRIVE